MKFKTGLHFGLALMLIIISDPVVIQDFNITILGSIQDMVTIVGYTYFATILSFVIPDAWLDREYVVDINKPHVAQARALHQLGICIIIAVLLFKVIL